jgi:hypothetical protein
MYDLLIVIPVGGIVDWRIRNQDEFSDLQLGTRRGRFKDGTRFRFIETESGWLEQIRGLRLRTYRIERGCNLTRHEITVLQARLQIS